MAEIKFAWLPPPAGWQLAADEVHVWAIALDKLPAQVAAFGATLSNGEQARAKRFHFERDQNRFTVGRGFMRSLLGRYLLLAPTQVELTYSDRGKPSLSSGAGPSPLHFNLAHSGGLALLAVTRLGRIGVDVEHMRSLKDADGIAERFFSTRESAGLQELSATQKSAAFFNLWTRKEAWLKATGQGISEALNRVEVSFLPGEPARLLSVFDDPEAAKCWYVAHLAPAPGFVGALAVEAREVALHCWQWQL